MPEIVVVQGMGKRYRRYSANRPGTFHEALLRGFWSPSQDFWALKDITFQLDSGKALGVIGRNGAGKSTLLRLIAGMGRPDRGSIRVKGRVRSLLTLGAGFHPDLTGRENVLINAVVGGLTRREAMSRLDPIIDFAELDEFIDSPLRVYSTGMQMRLAFSVAIHVAPDILLIDEVLSVGDLAFQKKCRQRLEKIKAAGSTIIIVSHDVEAHTGCDQCIWLQGGRLAAEGPPNGVIEKYLAKADAEAWAHTKNGHMSDYVIR